MQQRSNRERKLGFANCQDGAATGFGLIMAVLLLMFGGLAIDLAQYHAARTQLHAGADAAAHAALVARIRDRDDKLQAKQVGLRIMEDNMPPSRFGLTVKIEEDDIEFGRLDTSEPFPHQFLPDDELGPGHYDLPVAARVIASRNSSRTNAVRTYLLKIVGVSELAATTPSVFATYQPACLREGFVAEDRVDMQSNNEYLRGFCVHSNNYVSINQNNYFEDGTVVSMPDLSKLELPNSGYERNEGLEEALREDTMDIRILDQLETIMAGLRSGDSEYIPDYITSTIPNEIPASNNMTQDDLMTGAVNVITCANSNGSMSIKGGEVISDVVIVTNCKIDLGSNSRIENAVVATESTHDRSVNGPSRATFGADDGCAPGGGTQVITLGGMDFAANLGIFGSQLLARGDVSFAARSDGIEGASIVAGGEIDATSNSTMARCNSGMEGNFRVDYFRMAM